MQCFPGCSCAGRQMLHHCGLQYQFSRFDETAQQLAHGTGCFIRMDLSRTAPVRVNPFKGRMTIRDALCTALAGAGLKVTEQQADSITVRWWVRKEDKVWVRYWIFFCCIPWHFQHWLMPGRVTQRTGANCSVQMMPTAEPDLPGKTVSGAWMVAREEPAPRLMADTISPVHMRNVIPGIKAPCTRTDIRPERRIMREPEVAISSSWGAAMEWWHPCGLPVSITVKTKV